MKSLRVLAIAALIAGSSALASAQSWDHRDRDERFEHRDRDRERHFDRDRDDRRFRGDRDDWRFRRDRDDWRFRSGYVVRSEPTYTYYVGEQRYYNGYNWTWDGNRWCRRDHGVSFYLRF
jgi:Ni/Co efflux regulator RcnB